MTDENIKCSLLRDEALGIRQEIQTRTTAQHTLMLVAATLATGVGALAINSTHIETLLLLPILLSFVGLLWIGHHLTITKLFTYLANIYIDQGVNSYQREELKNRGDRLYRRYASTVASMYILFPVAVLVWFIAHWYRYPADIPLIASLLWFAGALFTLALIVAGYVGVVKEGSVVERLE